MELLIVTASVLAAVYASARGRKAFDGAYAFFAHEKYENDIQHMLDNYEMDWEAGPPDPEPEEDPDPEMNAYCSRCEDGPFGVLRGWLEPHLCPECRRTAAYEAREEVGCGVCGDEIVVDSGQHAPHVCNGCVLDAIHLDVWSGEVEEPDTEVDQELFADGLPDPDDEAVAVLEGVARLTADDPDDMRH